MSDAAKPVLAERTVTLTRILKAPRDLVWRAWTDLEMLKQWWGPEHFTNPVVAGDIKVGGILHITMHGPAGSPFDRDLPMIKLYREIVPGRKLVFENCPVSESGERMLEGFTTVTFTDHPEGTLLEMTTTARAHLEETRAWLQGMEYGWSQSFDKLGRLLEAGKA